MHFKSTQMMTHECWSYSGWTHLPIPTMLVSSKSTGVSSLACQLLGKNDVAVTSMLKMETHHEGLDSRMNCILPSLLKCGSGPVVNSRMAFWLKDEVKEG